jgi:hypothetical protein
MKLENWPPKTMPAAGAAPAVNNGPRM